MSGGMTEKWRSRHLFAQLNSIIIMFSFTQAWVVALSALACRAATLTSVTDFGANPSSITMAIYVPDTLPTGPSIIVIV